MLCPQAEQEDARWDNADYVLAKVGKDGLALRRASQRLRGSRDVVIAAVENNGRAICHASAELRADLDVATCAVQKYFRAFEAVHPDLFMEPAFVRSAAEAGAKQPCKTTTALDARFRFFCRLGSILRGDPTVVIPLLECEVKESEENTKSGFERPPCSCLAKYMLGQYWYEYGHRKKIMMQLLRINGFFLSQARPHLRRDKDVVLRAVQGGCLNEKDFSPFAYADQTLRDDKDVVLQAVRCDVRALKAASPRLKQDPHVLVMAARRKLMTCETAQAALECVEANQALLARMPSSTSEEDVHCLEGYLSDADKVIHRFTNEDPCFDKLHDAVHALSKAAFLVGEQEGCLRKRDRDAYEAA